MHRSLLLWYMQFNIKLRSDVQENGWTVLAEKYNYNDYEFKSVI